MNTEWQILSGAPDDVEWSSSSTDNASNLLETGNTIVTNQGADIVTSKKNKMGSVL